MLITPISTSLTPQKTLGELPCCEFVVESNSLVKEIVTHFNQHPDSPGVIIINYEQFVGMISREHCFEALGRPFGIELFLKLPVGEFYRQFGSQALLLETNTRIEEAVKAALARESRELYDPIVARDENKKYRLVDMHTLLTAQCELLSNLFINVRELSVKDPLTNIYNRRGFMALARPYLELAGKKSCDLSALMIDIDNFKMVNDIYGHFVGDCVIHAIVEECKKAIRQVDLLGRYGGEEFIILLPGTSLDNANKIADRIRSSIETLTVYVEGFQVSVTVSIGVSHFSDTVGSLDELINQADQALYSAKWAGRNQVIDWNPQLAQKVRMDLSISAEEAVRVQNRTTTGKVDAARVYDETVEGWARALEMRDKEAKGHAERVTSLTVKLARKLGFNEKELVDIRRGALLHDIGKIGIPDSILFKPGQLTDEEWKIMKKHPVYAFEMLSPITHLQSILDIPYCHHEHWDGYGYPRGSSGEEIPYSARIFTIIDVWDALSTDRCYRPAWNRDRIVSYLISESGKIFDPQILRQFLELINEQKQNCWNCEEQHTIQPNNPDFTYPYADFSVCYR